MASQEKISLFGVPYKTWKGQDFTLVWGFGPARRAEAAGFGLGTATNLVLALWAALLATHPKLTIDEAEELFDAEAFNGRGSILAEAILEAQNKAAGKKADPPAEDTENPPKPALQ